MRYKKLTPLALKYMGVKEPIDDQRRNRRRAIEKLDILSLAANQWIDACYRLNEFYARSDHEALADAFVDENTYTLFNNAATLAMSDTLDAMENTRAKINKALTAIRSKDE